MGFGVWRNFDTGGKYSYSFLRVRKKQIILLPGTSKNCEGQVNPLATCPRDECYKITSMDPTSCHYQILHWQKLWTSRKTFRQ